MTTTTPPVEDIYQELRKLQELDVIDYVLPTEPMGEQWVLGIAGKITKFSTEEIVIFLIGVTAVSQWMLKRKQEGRL